jgi:hypothetical protein
VVATVLFIYIIYDLFVNGKKVEQNPWDLPVFFTSQNLFTLLGEKAQRADTLEWKVDSPIPFHSYEELPVHSQA